MLNRKQEKKTAFVCRCVSNMIICFVLLAGLCATGYAANDAVVIYYSRTGKSEIIAKTIAENFNADIVQIKAPQYGEGLVGYLRATIDCTFNQTTAIDVPAVDLSKYSFVFLVCPIWGWDICVPMKTFIMQSDFRNDNLIMVTTANIDIKKYAHYKDDASFINVFFRDYLNRKSIQMRNIALSAKAKLTRHYHLATRGKSIQEMQEGTMKLILKDIQSPR